MTCALLCHLETINVLSERHVVISLYLDSSNELMRQFNEKNRYIDDYIRSFSVCHALPISEYGVSRVGKLLNILH